MLHAYVHAVALHALRHDYQVQLLATEYDKIKGVLASNETAGTLEALEQKLRLFEQNIFHLRECELIPWKNAVLLGAHTNDFLWFCSRYCLIMLALTASSLHSVPFCINMSARRRAIS
jgi:hypothetical protein